MQSFHLREIVKITKYFDLLNDSPEYRYLRKNMMMALKQHGDGLQHLEEMTIVYIRELLQKMEAEKHVAFDPKLMIKTMLGKLLMTLTYGSGNEEGLKKIAEVEEDSKFDMFNETGPCQILDLCPLLRFFVPSVKNIYNELLHQINTYDEIFRDLTERRKREYNEKNPKIYIDHFFNLRGKPVKVGPGIIKLPFLSIT